jgi:protein-tyrosine-phosphatase
MHRQTVAEADGGRLPSHFAGNKAQIYSAGVEAHGVNPTAIEIMKEDRIDISQHTSNNVNEYQGYRFQLRYYGLR